MYLSWGERPVYFPVLTDKEPVDVKIPSFLSEECSINFSTGRFLWIFSVLIPNSFNCKRNLGSSEDSDKIPNPTIKNSSSYQDF